MREAEGDDIWMHEAGQFRIEPQGPGRAIVYAYATHFASHHHCARRAEPGLFRVRMREGTGRLEVPPLQHHHLGSQGAAVEETASLGGQLIRPRR